jgi:HK97 family phage major capsid protein
MEEKDIQLIVEKVENAAGAKFTTLWDEAKKGILTPGQFADEAKKFAQSEDVKALTETVEKLAADFKAQNTGVNIEKTIEDMIMEQKDALLAFHEGRKDVQPKFRMKATFLSSGVVSNTQAIRIPGVNEPAHRLPLISELFSQFGIPANSGGAIRYVDQTTATRSAATRTEGNAAAESTAVLTERVLPIMNISDSIPASKESLRNFTYLESFLKKFITVNCQLREEAQVYSGDGNAPNLTGAYQTATAFDVGTMVDKQITDASEYDLIAYLAAYIAKGKNSKYNASYAVMNDMDVWGMLAKKDQNNNYIIPPFVRIQGQSIFVGPVQVIPTSLVTPNTMLIGDFRQGEYHADPSWEITPGFINDDFTRNLVRWMANKQAALLIKTIDATAFYKVADITAALTALSV